MAAHIHELIQDSQYRANKIMRQIQQDCSDMKGTALVCYLDTLRANGINPGREVITGKPLLKYNKPLKLKYH